MAELKRRLPTNVAGDFYVDESCIDCATCRWMDPATFDVAGDRSRVHTQPSTEEGRRRALMALVACPTASIGTVHKHPMAPVLASFPDPIEPGVYHCGFHAESSFGAASYLIVRPGGNILVDSPRFAEPLAREIESLGGVRLLFLTHRDDVADHERWHERFGCERLLHAADVGPSTRQIEQQPGQAEPFQLDEDLLVIPTPGHTRGSLCLLYQERVLCSGDHLAYNPELGHPYAFRDACWFDWGELVRSMKRLAQHRFERILPGHGWPCHYPNGAMAEAMARTLAWLDRA